MSKTSELVCVLAFSEPPESWGFRLSKAGTSWFIRIEADRVPRCLAALKREGIAAKALWPKLEMKNPPNSPSAFKGRQGERRPRGRQARAEYDTAQYVRKTARHVQAIGEAAWIHAAKERRNKLENQKRRAELAKQAAQAKTREQQHHADEVLSNYLLRHPVGSA